MREELLHHILTGRRALLPHTQPVVGLRSGRLEAKEYLARYVDDEGKAHGLWELLQDPVLPLGRRLELDLACLGATFKVLADLEGSEDHLHFINLEPLTLEAPGFWEQLPHWLAALRFSPERIVLEFTEAQSVHDLDMLQTYAARLRNQGLQIAVDDLGAGVASLTHMARLAPDFIKADRSLVTQVHRRPYQAALLNALAHFAERMCLGFIAEGIETAEELQAVVDADVPWGQGWILGLPSPTLPKPLVEGPLPPATPPVPPPR